MTIAHHGSSVTISYIGTLENGRIFNSTEEHGPYAFTIGSGQVFPALEQAIIGMKGGEVKNVVLTAAEAYGPRLTENIITLSRQVFPADKALTVGQKLSIEFKEGGARVMVVTAANDQEVTLDGNHPLAGLELTFALKLESVE